MPLDPKIEVATQLALALASIYAPGGNQTVSAVSALVAALANYRQATGRPEGWVPTAEEWNTLIAENESEIARRQARIAELESQL